MLDPAPVLSRLVELGVEKVSYSGGEPSRAPRIPEAIELGHQLGLKQVLTTNGDFLSPVPDWILRLEYLKLSVYGSRSGHEALMGPGHYDSLLNACRELSALGVVVGINYMLTRLSLCDLRQVLADWLDAGVGDIQIQTYIRNGRTRPDELYALPRDVDVVLEVEDLLASIDLSFEGRIVLQDYGVDDWYVVMTEGGSLTLPRGDGSGDWVMGDFKDATLQLPDMTRLEARDALERIWRTRIATPAIAALQIP